MKEDKVVFLRHKIVYKILRPIISVYTYLAYGYTCKKYKLEKDKPYLILANHNSNFDPFFISQSFDKVIYFVASDHIFRWGNISKIIKYLVAPIPIAKSQIDISCIKTMKKIVSQNGTIGLFPSGNKSFNGDSPYIYPSILKLIKMLKVPIVLYKIEGMYFSSPRWSRSVRKGKTKGYVVRVLEVYEINSLSNDELLNIINQSLYENAYELQNDKMIKYKGKNLAESLERVVYICPSCKQNSKLKSKGNSIKCSCGYEAIYDEFGFLKSNTNIEINTILKWDTFQKNYLKTEYENKMLFKENKAIYIDEEEKLYLCKKADTNTYISNGTLKMYEDKIEFVGDNITKEFFMNDISYVACHSAQVLQITLKDKNMYELKSSKPRSATKYMHMFNLIKYGGESDEFYGI